jgi:hypothetical protein
VHFWLADPSGEFRALGRTMRARLFGRAVGRLCKLGGKAAAVLGRLLADPSAVVRLGVCRTILLAARPGATEPDDDAPEEAGPVQVNEVIVRTREEAREFLARLREEEAKRNGHAPRRLPYDPDAKGGPTDDPGR